MSAITARFRHLCARSAATGETRRLGLRGGAALAVTARDLGAGCYQITLTLGRVEKPVGATEEITFRRDCLVPIGAQRYPAAPTAQVARVEDGVRWNLIGYTWIATAALWQGGLAGDVAAHEKEDDDGPR